eukprot:11176666-Lingulodinium_polyedra.AAC.1
MAGPSASAAAWAPCALRAAESWGSRRNRVTSSISCRRSRTLSTTLRTRGQSPSRAARGPLRNSGSSCRQDIG